MSIEEMTELPAPTPSPRPTQLHYHENGTTTTTTTLLCDNDTQNHSVVTERYLLARTKDERYVELCTKLLLRIMKEPFHHWKVFVEGWYSTFLGNRGSDGSISNNNSTSTANDIDDSTLIWKHEIMAEYISWILYILLTTKSRYHDNNNRTYGSLTTPGMEICQLEYDTAERNKNNTAINPNTCNSLMRMVSSRAMYAHLTSMAPLLSMTTIWYGIRFWSFHIQQKERQRRQPPLSHTYNRLTGQSRQDVFHSQRQEMIRRSQNLIINATTPITSPSSTNNSRCTSATSKLDQSLLQLIRRLYETFIVSIDTAIQSLPLDGPHYPVLPSSLNAPPMTHQSSGDNIHYTPPSVLPISAISSATLILVIQWTYQFYMAYYFLHGNYPTVLHRLFHIRPVHTVVRNTNTSADGTLSSSNTSNNVISMIGTLMMLQLSWKLLLYGISQPALDYWIRIKPLQHAFRHLRYCMKKVLGIPRHGAANGKHKSYIYMEGTVAPIHTFTTLNDDEIMNTNYDDNDPPSDMLVCGICRNSGSIRMNATSASVSKNNNPILFPSCSVKCGHVFCWYCIQQWLTYYDTKCPICRTACTANDIQLLYNY